MNASVSPVLAIEYVPIDLLVPDPENPREIDPTELESLERSIRRHGIVQPLVARRIDRVVTAGHQRLVAARRAGLSVVPVVFLDLGPDQAQLLGVALNRIGGRFDLPLLARLIAKLDERPGVDVSLSGLRDREITGLLRSLQTREKQDRPENFDFDDALEQATRTPRVTTGDVWNLGEHRVVCGDATSADDLQRALGGGRAAMAFTDPPYNVALGDHGGQQRGQRRRTIANDALAAEAWSGFVTAWARNIVSSVDGAIYICMSGKEWPLLANVMASVGGHWSDTIIYAKDRFVLGRADYQHGYEPLWYGWREGADRHWCGDRDQSDVWRISRPSAAPLHPVMKPLQLMQRAIGNSSSQGDIVLDPFLGSGSTLIACERTGRICAGVELDRRYVDVTIRRWEAFSGEIAVRDDAASRPPGGTAAAAAIA